MAKKFERPKHKKEEGKIQFPIYNKESAHSQLVKFSFKYLVSDHDSYLYKHKDSSYFLKLIERVAMISAMDCDELKSQYKKTLRNHYIKWDDTTQDGFGILNEEQLVDRPFQFSISVNEHGRVIGFFIANTFYVVWFDTEHNTYS